MRKSSLALSLAAALCPSAAMADSCLAQLAPPQGEVAQITIVTMDRDGIVSVASGTLEYRAPVRRRGGPFSPARWGTPTDRPAEESFSNRPPEGRLSRFIIGQIGVSMTAVASPAIQLTFFSRNNMRLDLSGTCSPGGILHGTSPNADVLITITKVHV